MCSGRVSPGRWSPFARARAPVAGRALDAEQRLHLVPGREDRERRQERQHEQASPRSDVRALDGASALRARPPACPLAPVVPLDRERIERRRVLGGAGRLRAGSGIHGNCRQYSSLTMVVEAGRLPVEPPRRRRRRGCRDGGSARCAGRDRARVAEATRADLAVLRVLDADGHLAARAVAPEGSALGAEVAGTRSPCERAAGEAPEPIRRAAERVRAAGMIAVPARAGGRVVGSVELLRVAAQFNDDDRALADLVAAQLALAVRTLAPEVAGARRRAKWLELAGEALAAGGDARRAAQQAVRIAMETTGARAGALWRVRTRARADRVARRLRSGLARAAALVTEALEHDTRPDRPRLGRWGPLRRCRSASRRLRRCSSSTPRTSLRRKPSSPRSLRSRPGLRMRCAPPSGPRARARARAHPRAARGGRRGDLAALARAHARDRRRADRASSSRSSRSACTCTRTTGFVAAAGRGLGSGARGDRRAARRSAPRPVAGARTVHAGTEGRACARRRARGARGRPASRRRSRCRCSARGVDRPARRLSRRSARSARARRRCSPRSPHSSPSPSRTRGCTSRRARRGRR